MNAFESLIASLLERDGYWVRSSFKVALTKEEKRLIGRPSAPRWEIDLVAYKPGLNELRFIECKSYLDSSGVSIKSFNRNGTHGASRFKLFNDLMLREVVLSRAATHLVENRYCLPNPKVTLCLAAGRIKSSEESKVRELFDSNGWHLYTAQWMKLKLDDIANDGYENSVASVVMKLRTNGG